LVFSIIVVHVVQPDAKTMLVYTNYEKCN